MDTAQISDVCVQTTESQLREDLAEAQLRIQSLETDLICARDQVADMQELIASLQAASGAARADDTAAARVAALEMDLQTEQQERAAMASTVAQAEAALIGVQAEVESVREQWRAAVRDGQIARQSAAAVLQEAEAEHAELQLAFKETQAQSAQVPALLRQIEVRCHLAMHCTTLGFLQSWWYQQAGMRTSRARL